MQAKQSKGMRGKRVPKWIIIHATPGAAMGLPWPSPYNGTHFDQDTCGLQTLQPAEIHLYAFALGLDFWLKLTPSLSATREESTILISGTCWQREQQRTKNISNAELKSLLLSSRRVQWTGTFGFGPFSKKMIPTFPSTNHFSKIFALLSQVAKWERSESIFHI